MSQIELILSRHGETEENKLHIMQGQLPGHLSELGKQQAKALAETLDKEELDVIVCSDLARSYDTAMAPGRKDCSRWRLLFFAKWIGAYIPGK